MKHIEHEYSFKVTVLSPFIEYCEKEGYKKIEETLQTRILYKRHDKTMLRITIKNKNGKITKEFDFKQDKLTDKPLVERKETIPIKYTDDEAIESIIDFLDYKKAIELKRKRLVYVKDNVKFELDDYSSPNQMYVVALEGNKLDTCKIYSELHKNYNQYFLDELLDS